MRNTGSLMHSADQPKPYTIYSQSVHHTENCDCHWHCTLQQTCTYGDIQRTITGSPFTAHWSTQSNACIAASMSLKVTKA